jgi:hypothetical protein
MYVAENLDPGVAVMESAEDGKRCDVPGPLNRACSATIWVKGVWPHSRMLPSQLVVASFKCFPNHSAAKSSQPCSERQPRMGRLTDVFAALTVCCEHLPVQIFLGSPCFSSTRTASILPSRLGAVDDSRPPAATAEGQKAGHLISPGWILRCEMWLARRPHPSLRGRL